MSTPVIRAGGWHEAEVPPPDPRVEGVQAKLVQKLVYGHLGFLDDALRLTPTTAVAGWSNEADGYFRVHLRDDVTYSDGTPLRAEDLVTAWRTWVEPHSRWPIPHVDHLDHATLLVSLPDLAPLVGLSDVSSLLLGRHDRRGRVGAGALWASDACDNGLVLTPRPSSGARRLHLVAGQNVAADLARMDAGEMDYLEVDGCVVPPGFEKTPTLRLRLPGSQLVCVAFNLDRRVLRDRGVRAGLAHAVDRQGLIMRAARGNASVADAMLGPRSPWAHDHMVEREYDVHEAELLLARAGWSRESRSSVRHDRMGRPLSLRLVVPAFEPVLAAAARAIADDLGLVAVQTTVHELEPGSMATVMESGDFDAAVLTLTVRPNGTDLFRLYHSVVEPAAQSNPWRYSNPDVDSLLEAAFSWDGSATERKTLLRAVQDIVNDDVLHIPLFRRQRAVFTADERVPHETHGDYTALYRIVRGSSGTAPWAPLTSSVVRHHREPPVSEHGG